MSRGTCAGLTPKTSLRYFFTESCNHARVAHGCSCQDGPLVRVGPAVLEPCALHHLLVVALPPHACRRPGSSGKWCVSTLPGTGVVVDPSFARATLLWLPDAGASIALLAEALIHSPTSICRSSIAILRGTVVGAIEGCHPRICAPASRLSMPRSLL